MNYKQIAKDIITYCNDVNNINSVTHCSTRLRLFIKNKQEVDIASLKKLDGVLGIVYTGDELQIILGKNLIPIYNEVSNLYEAKDPAAYQEKPTATNVKEEKSLKKRISSTLNKVIGFVSASVTPLIPGLVAGGMLKVFLLLITLLWESFADTQTYGLLSMLADIPFYFMPVFVAYGASKKLGATPLYAMMVSAALIYPNFLDLFKDGGSVSIINIPVTAVKYNSTLLPALLISVCAYYVEKGLVKMVPGIIRPIFVGMLTIIVTFILGITILGPLGDMAGSYVVNVFLWSSEHLGPLAVGILAGCMPLLVMTGMHHAVTPFMAQAIVNPGYDVLFRPAYLLHNMAEGGACLGVALRTKNKAFKTECFSLAVGCILAGVTEPAIYGVNLRLKKPMIGVIIGAATGGVVAGILGATAYVYGYSTLLAVPIFQDTIVAILIAIIVAIIVAAITTFLLGFDEGDIKEA